MALRVDDISINTIIGSGSFLTGDIKVNGFVRLDGDIKGNLETDGSVIVGENSRIQGNIKAKSVIINGIVIGTVTADESIKVMPNSVLIGDAISHKVQIFDKSVFNGQCISIRNHEQFEIESEKYLQSTAIKRKVIF